MKRSENERNVVEMEILQKRKKSDRKRSDDVNDMKRREGWKVY